MCSLKVWLINNLQLEKYLNTTIHNATEYIEDTSTQHLHEETSILPIKQHIKLHASQLRQKAQRPEHTPHQFTLQPRQPRDMKQTTFHNVNYTTDIFPDTTNETVENNMIHIHREIV